MSEPPIGVIAGLGQYPVLLCQKLRRCGVPVAVAGIAGHASSSDFPQCSFGEFKLGQVGAASAFLTDVGASNAIMAGAVSWHWGRRFLKPDWALLLALPLMLINGDDWKLRYIANLFEKRGVSIVSAAPWIHTWFAQSDDVFGPVPNDATARLIERGLRECRSFVQDDRGQAITVFGERGVKYESRRGTNDLLARTPGVGAVLIKMKKAAQDMRFDIPTVGPDTVWMAHRKRIGAIAVEAGAVLIIEKNEVAKLCRELNVSFVAV
ncbi:MAG: UDP-2,3-diacylglucosamine diphosphatase LpxI [Deltaproteobacteria bacterium]|nr:UDP-2,3-diacylglucosamine diphosphatase LpxI [Deltaproteobacteria bacterium]